MRAQDSFLLLAFDSVMAITVASEARSDGLDLLVAQLLKCESLTGVSDLVADRPRIYMAPMDPDPFSLCDPSSPGLIRKQPSRLEVQQWHN